MMNQDGSKHSRPGCFLWTVVSFIGLGGLILIGLMLAGYALDDILSGEATENMNISEVGQAAQSGFDEGMENEALPPPLPDDELVPANDDNGEETAVTLPDPEENNDDAVDNSEPAANSNGSEPAEPENEANDNSDDPEIEAFTDLILGVSAKAYTHYSMGSTAGGLGGSEPYFFVNPGACGMKVEVRTMPTAAVPGATASEGLETIFQTQYVENSMSSVSWQVTEETAVVEMYLEPAARMTAARIRNDEKSYYQLTLIRGETRAALVQGQINETCAARPASRASLDEITNSIELSDPAAVCYVAMRPDSSPAEYNVGCDYERTGVTGLQTLADRGFTESVLGPATWDECAAFMRNKQQPYWDE